ncbi:MAG TPA: glucodextranase DOMON-like domain-containing protein [Solirubrobacteraceae bacterium]|nr:glucodextranase DOMON-like domain-containing protein [Solirubrobacteraceae bacterium]
MAVTAAAFAVAGAVSGSAGAQGPSLPSVRSGHRPGPDALYLAPADAPQLQNIAPWRAPPILVSGATAYRHGEFLYQDFLYDDHGAAGGADPNSPFGPSSHLFSPTAGTYTYPTDPVYANNAADLIEFRIRPLADATAFRVTLNTLKDPQRTAFTIALGGTPSTSVPWPHGAGVSSPAALFVTVHGATAELTDATGTVKAPAPTATVDLTRRQIDVRVPHAAWNPGGTKVRTTVGVGLWDPAAGAYLAPVAGSATATAPGGAGPARAALVNVGPRLSEPYPDLATTPGATIGDAAAGAAVQGRWWRDRQQADALRLGDISQFYADVDFSKLAAGTADESGVPQAGVLDRILVSHYAFGQGLDPSRVCYDLAAKFSAGAQCIGRLVGQLQPYALYVPRKPEPASGWGMTLLLHSLSANYNQYSASRNQSELGDRGAGSLVLTPSGRGPDGFYAGMAEADTFEAWADVGRHYHLDPDWSTVSGYSMGGFGTYRLLARWPDLFSRGMSTVGIPGTADPQVASLRNTPIMAWNAAGDELVQVNQSEAAWQHLAAAGLRFREWLFPGADHLTLATNDEYGPAADFLGSHRVDRNPAHVTYVAHPAEDSPGAQTVADHAYWLSGVATRDAKSSPVGTIDVRSEGFGTGDPKVLGVQQGAGTLNGGYHGPTPYVERRQEWGPAPATPVRDVLDISATNVSTVSIDPARARVTCAPRLNVTSDGPLTVVIAGCGPSGRQGFRAGRSSRALTCNSRRRLVIRLRHPHGSRVLAAEVFIGSRHVRSVRARGASGALRRLTIDLRGRLRGTVTVRVRMRVLGRGGRARTITDRRVYRTCIPGRRRALSGRPRRRRR